MTTYSFQDFNVTLAGPTGVISLGYGAGVAEGGVTVARSANLNSMKIGIDGRPMHSMLKNESGTITIELQRVSPKNAALSAMANLQNSTSALHGKNVLTVTNSRSKEVSVATSVAFQKMPDLGADAEGKTVQWVFDAGKINTLMGTY